MAIFSDMPTEGEIEDLYEQFCEYGRKDGLIDVKTMARLMVTATNEKDWSEAKVNSTQPENQPNRYETRFLK